MTHEHSKLPAARSHAAALETLKAHFSENLRGESIKTAEELDAFMAAAVAVSQHALTAAIFGSWILGKVCEDYSNQLGEALRSRAAP